MADLVVMKDFPVEQVAPVEYCDTSDQWRVILHITLTIGNNGVTEWGSFDPDHGEEGFNGVVGDMDTHHPSQHQLDQRVLQALNQISLKIGVAIRYEWLSGSDQLEVVIEGGETVEKFDLAIFHQALQEAMS